MYCGKKLPPEASFCMACGKAQESESEPTPPEASGGFALVEDDDPPAAPPPKPAAPPPARAPDSEPLELEPSDLETIELDSEPDGEPAAAKDEPSGDDEPPESEDTGGRTVRMPLADVVQAWAEDADTPPSTTPDAGAPKIPLMSNPKFVITVLVVAAVAVGAAVLLLR